MDRQRGRYSQQAAIDELQRRGLWGYVEPILTFGSAVVAEPVSGMMGLAALPWGSGAATRAINRTQDALTYQPRTEQGQEALQAAGEFLQPVGDAFIGASEYLGDAAYDATGSPALGAAAYSVPTMALEALGLKGAKAASKGRAAYEFGDISDYTKGLSGKQRGIFAGVKAKGADLKAMEAAKELQARGLSRDEIWQKTGWFEDVDGQWKWEIDDSGARALGFTDEQTRRLYRDNGFLTGDAGRFIRHKKLYESYPDTKDIDMMVIDTYGDRGGYAPAMPETADDFARAEQIDLGAKNQGVNLSTGLHELQHSLQYREGFARGGNMGSLWPDSTLIDLGISSDELRSANMLSRIARAKGVDAGISDEAISLFESRLGRAATDNEKWLAQTYTPDYLSDQGKVMRSAEKYLNERKSLSSQLNDGAIDNDAYYKGEHEAQKRAQFELYQKLAGEAEARNVEARLDFTPEQRRATPPWQTLDVPEDELIVRRDNMGTSHSLPNNAMTTPDGTEIPSQSKGVRYIVTPDGRVLRNTEQALISRIRKDGWHDVTDSPQGSNALRRKQDIEQHGSLEAAQAHHSQRYEQLESERLAARKEAEAAALKPDGYKMQHQAPMRSDYPNGANLNDVFPDIYSAQGLSYYSTGMDYDSKAMNVIRSMKGNPNKEIVIYRAVPEGVDVINKGDWVTTTREYALDHIGDDKGYKIISKKVRARDIATDGNSIHEWGYDPE